MAVLVLDIGKTNAKLILLDESGATLATRTRPSVVRPGPPYPHLDLDGTWEWLKDMLPEIAAGQDVRAVVPVAHGAAAVLMAGDAPALPAIDYEFEGPDETAAELVPQLDPFELTGTPVLPLGLNVGAQLHWQERRFPQAFARATDLLLLPQYWAWRLSGVKASEVTSLGAHNHLWRPVEGGFSDFAKRRCWDRLVPPLRKAWEVLGPARPELGLPAGCAVLTGIHDSNCSYLPHAVARPAPFAVVSTGTWIIIMAAGVPVERLRPELDMLCNVDALGRPAPTTRFMGGREVELLAGADGMRTPATLEDVAVLVADSVMALPSFAVGSGPYMGRKGEILGEPGAAPARKAALAALYAALTVDAMLDNLGSTGPVLIEGSFHKNAAFAGVLAALRPDQPVHAIADASGTTKGAWLLANWERGLPPAEPLPAAVQPWAVPGLEAYQCRWRELAASTSRRAG